MIRTEAMSLLGRTQHSLWLQGLEHSELTTIHQTSNFLLFKRKNCTVTAVCTWMWGISLCCQQTIMNQDPHTAITPMSPHNPWAICCLEQVRKHYAHQGECHESVERCGAFFTRQRLNISYSDFFVIFLSDPKTLLLVLSVLPSVQLAPP